MGLPFRDVYAESAQEMLDAVYLSLRAATVPLSVLRQSPITPWTQWKRKIKSGRILS